MNSENIIHINFKEDAYQLAEILMNSGYEVSVSRVTHLNVGPSTFLYYEIRYEKEEQE